MFVVHDCATLCDCAGAISLRLLLACLAVEMNQKCRLHVPLRQSAHFFFTVKVCKKFVGPTLPNVSDDLTILESVAGFAIARLL